MATRPFLNANLPQLARLTDEARDDAGTLRALERELAARRSPQAAELRRTVAARLAVLGGAGAPDPAVPVSAEERALRRVAELEAELARVRHELEVVRGLSTQRAALLERVRREVAAQAGELVHLRAQLEAALAGPPDAADYARVGARPDIPDFALAALRTAWRKATHPDARPPGDRTEAEARFKEIEAAFERLFRARGIG